MVSHSANEQHLTPLSVSAGVSAHAGACPVNTKLMVNIKPAHIRVTSYRL